MNRISYATHSKATEGEEGGGIRSARDTRLSASVVQDASVLEEKLRLRALKFKGFFVFEAGPP